MKQVNKRIIVFDDEQDILSICQLILESVGWEVFTFNTCKDIVDRVEAIDPAIVLIDHRIPALGGVLSTQLLKNSPALKHIPVILFSAVDNLSALADEAGADSFLAKPFDIGDLENIITFHTKNSIV